MTHHDPFREDIDHILADADTPVAGHRKTPGKAALASFLGSTLEYYDFFIFGTAAALVFPRLFFPSGDPTIAAVASFMAFGAAYIARPLGGLVMGHFGDRIGRKQVLLITLGIMGVAAAGAQRPHSVPPGPHGGNIDINLLVEGAVLYLPVQVPGAGFYTGDPHFAQGDGEVSLTALEASLRATVRLDVVPAAEASERFGDLAGPLAETSEYLVPTGLDADLDVAMANCVRAALALLQARYGMDRHLAYAYLSAATDFDISQVVDLVKGVHARIRKADFVG